MYHSIQRDRGARFNEIAEVVLPYAFFLEAAEEALDQAVLLRSIGSDGLLAQAIAAAYGAKAPALKHQSIVRGEEVMVGEGRGGKMLINNLFLKYKDAAMEKIGRKETMG